MQPVTDAGTPEAMLVLNRAKLDELRRAHGIESEAKLARTIGVSAETLWRVSNGGKPSNAFMARVKLAFPSASLDVLFEMRVAA